MRSPIAKEGFIFIIPLAFLSALFYSLDFIWLAGLFEGLFLFCAWFFRDPERDIPKKPNVVVSPADGKVVEIIKESDEILIDRGDLSREVRIEKIPFLQKIKKIGLIFWKTGDINTIDRFGPDGFSKIIKIISDKAVNFQSGHLYHYAFVMLVGLSILLTYLILY